jgi:hypothetical protein
MEPGGQAEPDRSVSAGRQKIAAYAWQVRQALEGELDNLPGRVHVDDTDLLRVEQLL